MIEVTEEMVNAGAFEAREFESAQQISRNAMKAIYKAMRALEPTGTPYGVKAEPEEWAWCRGCEASFPPGSAHFSDPHNPRHSRKSAPHLFTVAGVPYYTKSGENYAGGAPDRRESPGRATFFTGWASTQVGGLTSTQLSHPAPAPAPQGAPTTPCFHRTLPEGRSYYHPNERSAHRRATDA